MYQNVNYFGPRPTYYVGLHTGFGAGGGGGGGAN